MKHQNTQTKTVEIKDQQVQTATIAQNQGTYIYYKKMLYHTYTLFAFFLAYHAYIFLPFLLKVKVIYKAYTRGGGGGGGVEAEKSIDAY